MPEQLLQMLSYMRPAYSRHEAKFAKRYLAPVFGEPDIHGNYVLEVGGNPNRIAFMAHYDTVHRQSGRQKVSTFHDYAYVTGGNSSCLGADCTTGVWLILKMIEDYLPGLYIVHAAEEIGCVGSSNLVKDNPDLLQTFDFALSLDRFGTDSIITHQMGVRTASDKFAKQLAGILDMPMKPDPTGSYTDSNEYADYVSECTNISVGYYDQHTKKEAQNLVFAKDLLQSLLAADWSQLKPYRDPEAFETIYRKKSPSFYPSSALVELIQDYPEEIAEMLQAYGHDAFSVAEELGIDTAPGFTNRALEWM